MTEDSGFANVDELLDLDLVSVTALIEAQEVSPVELTRAYLDRIAATENDLNAYALVDSAGAMSQAVRASQEIRAGRQIGALHGIPIGVKDLIDTAGLRTTYGSPLYEHHVPATDAVVVTKLREAGAIILGKQSTHEFAWGGRTDSTYFGPTHNPHDLGRIPGGSSGGGAASIAARSSLLAIGTDTAGSVRIPAALSGCVGFKPSRDWIGLAGIHPLAPSFDHVGLMTRTVGDLEILWRGLGGETAPQRSAAVRIGWLRGTAEDVLSEEVAQAVRRTVQLFRDRGATIIELTPPDMTTVAAACLQLILAEGEAIHRDAFRRHPDAYGADLATLLRLGQPSREARESAFADLARVVSWIDEVMKGVDVLLSATVPVTAPPIGCMELSLDGQTYAIEPILTRLTSIANASGRPAVSVPAAGLGVDALPIGIQMIGNVGKDADLLDLA